MASTSVDDYIRRSDQWPDVMSELRPVLLDRGLDEAIKWGQPCYSHRGKNVVIMQEMKDFLALMFFKGALMRDPDGVLEEQGENTRSARRMQFTSVDDAIQRRETLARYVDEAIAVEESGRELPPAAELVLADELQRRLEQDPELRAAFEGLTPGRQREYNLFVSGAKQSSTRESRVDKHVARIKAGKGLRDR